MAITPSGFDFLLSVMPAAFHGEPERGTTVFGHENVFCTETPAYRGLRMLELGNQHFHDANRGLMERDGSHVTKPWFTARGIEHVSIDLNGSDGALQRDICGDLSDLGKFDVVTNFGSSEHVEDQWACWTNIHRLCKLGGLMVHSVPLVGHWPGHCRYRYSVTFFAMLASLNGYGLWGQTNIDRGCGEHRHLIHAAFRRYDDRDQFVFPASELDEQ